MDKNNFSETEIKIFDEYKINYQNLSLEEIEKQLEIIYNDYYNSIISRLKSISQKINYLDN